MNFLAAEASNATQWILPAILLVLVIGIFLLNYFRSKKNQESMKNMVDALKVGDNVKTYSGIYGKIIEIVETTDGKVAVLETGSEKNKGIFSIDINAIYGIDEKKPVVYDANGNVVSEEAKSEEKAEENKENANGQPEAEKPKKRGKKAKKEEPVLENKELEPLQEQAAEEVKEQPEVEETKEQPDAKEVLEEKPKRKSKKQK